MYENIEKIIVVGSVVVDEIHTREGSIFEDFGGITYSIITLANLLKKTRIIPIAYIGKEDYHSFENLLSTFPNVDLSFILFSDKGSNRNVLRYKENGEREEFFKKITPPIEIKSLLTHLDADASLINFIKNDDLSFETLKTFSYAYRNTLYIDIHSLLREVDEKGRFVLRSIPNWQRWISMGDIVQMNRGEARAITGIDIKSLEDVQNLALLLLGFGCKVINITLGEKGTVVAWKERDKKHAEYIPAPQVDVVDPTGCGDVYGASFLFKYLETKDPLKSANFANKEAAKSATWKGLGLDQLR